MNPSSYNDKSTFIRRLSYFLIGTAIGLFILGIMNQQRKKAAMFQQQQSQQQQQQQPAQPPSSP